MIINSFKSSVGLVIDTLFTFRDVTGFSPDLREVSSLIVCQVFLESPLSCFDNIPAWLI